MAYVTALSTLQNNIAGTYTLLRDMDQALHFFEESHRLEQTSASLSVSVAAKAIFVTLLYNTQYWLLCRKKGDMDKGLLYLRKAATFPFEHDQKVISDLDRLSL